MIDLLEQRGLVERRALPGRRARDQRHAHTRRSELTSRAQGQLFAYVQSAFMDTLKPHEITTLARVFTRLLNLAPPPRTGS